MNRNSIPAYELIREETLGDIHAKGYLLSHKKTGARVMLIENDDENKVFNIAFRTPPKDSTGVAHIVEHTVLCGSKHFPLKDPFVELVKGSLNTFLNAMTFPDKTMYPVASCNDQDFQNLMHIYLDAVFYPNIYHKKEIFRQEGWDYKLPSAEEPLTYNGVVYNEMKGALSSEDELLEDKVMTELFPDTTYGVCSGGDPKDIPKLTYEAFLDFHRTYYHPSNSYIYLYGKMDMAEKLDFIDREYLSAFDRKDISSEIPMQKPFDRPKDAEGSYPVLESESTADKTSLSFHAVIGDNLDAKLVTAFQVLDYALLSAPGAPLKQALLDAGICKDVYGGYNDGTLQPTFHLVAKKSNPESMADFKRILSQTLERLVTEGIDRKSLEAGIHVMEFRFREADYASYPKGLMYGIDVFSTWLYDDRKPFDTLKLLDVFEELKQEVNTGYFEQLVKTWLIENPHALYLVFTPEKGLGEKIERETERILKEYKESLSEEEIRKLTEETKALEAYQETEDSPEALACIPLLRREDLKKEACSIMNEVQEEENTTFLFHEVDTNGIGYLRLYFSMDKVPQELVPYIGLLKAVLANVNTEHYTYGELANEINATTGGISTATDLYRQKGEDFTSYFLLRASFLNSRLEAAFDLLREILLTSDLEAGKRIYEIVARMKSRMQSSIPGSGHSSAVARAMSYHSPLAWMQEQISGIAFYDFIEKLETEYEQQKEKTTASLRELMAYLFGSDSLTVSFTGDRQTLNLVKEKVKALKAQLPQAKQPAAQPVRGCCDRKNEGFMTPGQVQYVAQIGNFTKKGLEYTGALQILKHILSYDYLWKNIREKGGAYGCMSGFSRNGDSYFVSYRDPRLAQTFDVYRGVAAYLRGFTADERAMTKYIIGTVSGLDVPKTPKMKGIFSASAWFMNITQEQLQKERDQILQATQEDIRALAPLMEAIVEDHEICVIGNAEKIKENEKLFDSVRPLAAE